MYVCVGWQKASHLAEHMDTQIASVCVALSHQYCVFVCLCLSVWCTCISASKPHLQFTAASIAHCPNLCLLILFFLLFSSVHCFGLQLLYLFRLTGGLALPPGFRMGNGVAKKGVDNRDRLGLDHPLYTSSLPNITPQHTVCLPPKHLGHGHLLLSLSFAISHLSFVSIPCHSARTFFLFFFFFNSHSILLDSLPLSLLISPLSGLPERRSASD